MKIVIEIDDNIYTRLFDNGVPIDLTTTINDTEAIATAIRNGTPLPEHHGRIIDESKINNVFYNTEEVIYNNIKAINTTITHTDAPTIIEGAIQSE